MRLRAKPGVRIHIPRLPRPVPQRPCPSSLGLAGSTPIKDIQHFHLDTACQGYLCSHPSPRREKGRIESVRKLLRDKRLHRVLLKVTT